MTKIRSFWDKLDVLYKRITLLIAVLALIGTGWSLLLPNPFTELYLNKKNREVTGSIIQAFCQRVVSKDAEVWRVPNSNKFYYFDHSNLMWYRAYLDNERTRFYYIDYDGDFHWCEPNNPE